MGCGNDLFQGQRIQPFVEAGGIREGLTVLRSGLDLAEPETVLSQLFFTGRTQLFLDCVKVFLLATLLEPIDLVKHFSK